VKFHLLQFCGLRRGGQFGKLGEYFGTSGFSIGANRSINSALHLFTQQESSFNVKNIIKLDKQLRGRIYGSGN